MAAIVKKHPKRTVGIIIAIIAAFLVPLLLVHILFKIKLGIPWLEAEWEAGDVLAYSAGFEALLGTLFLGCITVKQSDDAQRENIRISEAGNHLQEIAIQKLIPVVEITEISVDKSQEIDSKYVLQNALVVSETVTHEARKKKIIVYTNPVKSKRFFQKALQLSLKNISDSIIRQIIVEKIEFLAFNIGQETVPKTSCTGVANMNVINGLLLPDQVMDIQIEVDYDDERLTRFWEYNGDCSIGAFDMHIYLKNIGMTGVEYSELIVIDKGEDFKERIMYKAYEEGHP